MKVPRHQGPPAREQEVPTSPAGRRGGRVPTRARTGRTGKRFLTRFISLNTDDKLGELAGLDVGMPQALKVTRRKVNNLRNVFVDVDMLTGRILGEVQLGRIREISDTVFPVPSTSRARR